MKWFRRKFGPLTIVYMGEQLHTRAGNRPYDSNIMAVFLTIKWGGYNGRTVFRKPTSVEVS